MIIKDFYKLDVIRLDIEKLADNIYNVNVNNSISWDNMNLNVTREELKGLADFINRYLENDV